MVAAPLPRVRTPEYVRTEAARANPGLERHLMGLRDGDISFWYRWLDNPDNLCTQEALDAVGW